MYANLLKFVHRQCGFGHLHWPWKQNSHDVLQYFCHWSWLCVPDRFVQIRLTQHFFFPSPPNFLISWLKTRFPQSFLKHPMHVPHHFLLCT